MGKRLTDCITSQYIGAANRLNSKKARRRIVAYVESYDDIFFWRSVLTRFENDERYFEVLLPSRLEHLERGKKAAIMSMIATGGVGKNMIACVDADYDYVAQGATFSSKTILENPYIFHSYAYAIENMQCYAPSLHNVCVAVTLNDAQKFDFEAFLADFSTTIFPLFVWNVWSYRNAAERRFTISDFVRSIEMGSLSPENASAAIAQLRRRVAHKVKTLQSQHPGAKESYLKVGGQGMAMALDSFTIVPGVQPVLAGPKEDRYRFQEFSLPDYCASVCVQRSKEGNGETFFFSFQNLEDMV